MATLMYRTGWLSASYDCMYNISLYTDVASSVVTGHPQVESLA